MYFHFLAPAFVDDEFRVDGDDGGSRPIRPKSAIG